MVDFINEVEEELRKDEYNRLLKRFGPLLLAIIIGIVAVAGFIQYRDYTEDKAARATSASYVDASNLAADGNADQSITEFLEIADLAPSGYAGLSLIRAAALKLDKGQRVDAVNLLDQAANTFETPRHTQLAQIKAAYILANDGAYNDVISRLGPLAEKDAPYEFLARELMGFAALQVNDDALAREQYGYLESIPGVPPTIKERAEQALSLMRTESSLAANSSPASAPQQSVTETPNDE